MSPLRENTLLPWAFRRLPLRYHTASDVISAYVISTPHILRMTIVSVMITDNTLQWLSVMIAPMNIIIALTHTMSDNIKLAVFISDSFKVKTDVHFRKLHRRELTFNNSIMRV